MRKVVFLLAVLGAIDCASEKTELYCGDGKISAGEECEAGNLGGKNCTDLGFNGGELSCNDQCRFDTSACLEADFCGNGKLEGGEECEPSLPLSLGCEELGFSGGKLSCSAKCIMDASDCSCADDSTEENDTAALAKRLEAGTNQYILCNSGGEEDWFYFDAAAEQKIYLKLKQEPLIDLDLELFDEAGTLLAKSAAGFLDEEIYYTAEAAGRFLVRVFSYADFPGSVGYSLDLALDPQCRDSRDCSATSVCRAYTCVQLTCSEQNPCPEPLVCHEGHCAECETPTDCPEADAYLCQQNTCVYSCSEDSLEPNSSYNQAAVISAGFEQALTLCGPQDSDWFRVSLQSGRLYRMQLLFERSRGDINLLVYNTNDLGQPVAMGHGVTEGEALELAVKNSHDYYLVVRLGYDQLAQTYTLVFSDLGEPECLEDSQCQADSLCMDYRCLAVECQIDSDCQAPKRCSAGTCLGAPSGDECQNAIVISALPFVYEAGQFGGYRNHFSFAAGDCTADGTMGYDVIFSLTLEPGQTVRAKVTSDNDLALVLAADCGEELSASACLAAADDNLTGDEEIVYTSPSGGQHFIVVDSYCPGYPDQGSFRLEVSAE